MNIGANILNWSTAKVAQIVAGGGQRNRLLILMYHRIGEHTDVYLDNSVDRDAFERHLAILTRYFNVLPLGEAVSRLREGTLPLRAACITFDDGYADNHSVALPILKRYGVSATFFITTGYLDGGRMWNDTVIEAVRCAEGESLDLTELELGTFGIKGVKERRETIAKIINALKYHDGESRLTLAERIASRVGKKLPVDLMLTSKDVKKMAQEGMEIGAHTVTHPILARLSLTEAEGEIRSSKHDLESLIDREVIAFAFPNGKPGTDYVGEHVELVREAGFRYCVSTAYGVAREEDDCLQLPRIGPWDRKDTKLLARLIVAYGSDPAARTLSPGRSLDV